MSIHAVKPETEAALRRQRRTSFITSSIISVLVVILLLAILSLFLLSPLFKETPVIVSYQSSTLEDDTVVERKVSTAIDRHRPQAVRTVFLHGESDRLEHRIAGVRAGAGHRGHGTIDRFRQRR